MTNLFDQLDNFAEWKTSAHFVETFWGRRRGTLLMVYITVFTSVAFIFIFLFGVLEKIIMKRI